MPTPRRGESHDDFIERCIPIVIDDGAADNGSQARAICESMWQNRGTRSEARSMYVKTFDRGQIKQMDDEGRGVAVIATLNVIDKDGDVTLPGAFGEQVAQMVPAHNWGHVPLGKGTVREDDDQVLVDFQMNLDTPSAREWHSALKFDLDNGPSLQEWSYGFSIKADGAEMGTFEGQNVQFLKALDVHEFSPVLLGAGEGTRTLAIKSTKPSRKFADQISEAITEIDDIVERAKAIREERKKDGRDISPERIEQLKAFRDSLAALLESTEGLLPVEEPPVDVGKLLGEVAATQAKLQGRI